MSARKPHYRYCAFERRTLPIHFTPGDTRSKPVLHNPDADVRGRAPMLLAGGGGVFYVSPVYRWRG